MTGFDENARDARAWLTRDCKPDLLPDLRSATPRHRNTLIHAEAVLWHLLGAIADPPPPPELELPEIEALLRRVFGEVSD